MNCNTTHYRANSSSVPGDPTVWRQADKYKVPRICFVNKMDRIGADFEMSLGTIREKLGANAVALQIPLGSEEKHQGVIDLVRMKALVFHDSENGSRYDTTDIPAEFQEVAEKYRTTMVEALAELDDGVMGKYLDGKPLEDEELQKVIRKGCVTLKIFPVLCGSAFKHKGVQPLLDAVVDYLPSPLDIPPMYGKDPKGNDVVRETNDKAPFSALAFKVMTDPFVGALTFIRVYSGRLDSGSYTYNPVKEKKERVQKLMQMRADKRDELEECLAGDICAVVGLRATTTGDTICDEKNPVVLERIEFPEPVIDIAIEPKSQADQEKLGASLAKLAVEDPSFRVRTDGETGQTLIAGMGELHLEIIVDRLLREFKVDANVGKPRVAYRETITRAAEAEGKYIRQTGGKGQYGHVWIRVIPNERGKGFAFENKTVGGVIPKEFIPPIHKSTHEAMDNGVLSGYPMVDIRVELFDGSFHDVDSSEIAYKIASSMAFKDACNKAAPVLLEPIMNCEIVTPEATMGDVIGDLNARRGKINGMNPRHGIQVIEAQVPLSQMFGYSTDLRSRTQGRATYTMQFSHYAPVP